MSHLSISYSLKQLGCGVIVGHNSVIKKAQWLGSARMRLHA
jgi:hypothetical protein